MSEKVGVGSWAVLTIADGYQVVSYTPTFVSDEGAARSMAQNWLMRRPTETIAIMEVRALLKGKVENGHDRQSFARR